MPCQALHEIYATAIPIFAPSVQFLTEEFKRGRGYPHKVAGNTPCGPSSYLEGSDGIQLCCSETIGQTCFDPNSCDEDALHQWVALGDVYQLPNITYFDSPKHLVDTLEHWTLHSDKRAMAIAAMQKHNSLTFKRDAKTIQDLLQNMTHFATSNFSVTSAHN